MISKGKIKFINSLRHRKVREINSLFVIEGDKLIKEYLLSGKRIINLVANNSFIDSLSPIHKKLIDEIISVDNESLQKISSLVTPHNALAVVPFIEHDYVPEKILKDLSVAIDSIQDPGNLGTIIRSAAWFGIKNIVCSRNCVDLYNPKVIQSTMGAFMNINVFYCNLTEFLKKANDMRVIVYGTLMKGKSVYSAILRRKSVILLGNESRGISRELQNYVAEKITIPKFSDYKFGIDSLNVSIAASIIFSEFARRPDL